MISDLILIAVPVFLVGFASAQGPTPKQKIEIVRELLKSLETKDPKPPSTYINSGKYIQHNLQVADGLAGVKQLISRLPNNSTVNTVRIFADGDFVVAQSEYEFFGPKVGFDVFRFEDGKVVEHWDNLEEKCAHLNLSGRSQLDGPTEVAYLDKTESNKSVVKAYFDSVVLGGQPDKVSQYRSMDNFHQHNCDGEDNKTGSQLKTGPDAKPGFVFKIEKVHKILGQGNSVLVMSEGLFDAKPTAFYDMYRIEDNKMVEHWDVLEAIPPKEQWKNSNGKF